MVGAKVNDWKPLEGFVAIPNLPPDPKTVPIAGSATSRAFFHRGRNLELRSSILLVLREQLASPDRSALQNCIGLRN